MPGTARSLRLVHGRVGVHDHLLADGLSGSAVRDSDTGGDRQLKVTDEKGLVERVGDAGREDLGVVWVLEVLAQEDELVSRDPRQRVSGPQQM
jgi:hypothetical protein